MPDSLAKQIRAEMEAKRSSGPPTAGGMIRSGLSKIHERVDPFVPEAVKEFWETAKKPIAGPFSGVDIALGGPLLGGAGMALKGLSRMTKAAAPVADDVARVAEGLGTVPSPAPLQSQSALYRTLSQKPIITPGEANQLKTLEPAVKQQASKVGLSYAAGGKGEAGFVSTDLLKSIPKGALDAWLQLRSLSYLSGLAPLKSVAGNIGAFPQAAVSLKSTKPLTEALRVPTNLRVAAEAWKEGANPSSTVGVGRLNPIGRAMGALDAATQQALQRGGVSQEAAQKLLLTNPNKISDALEELGTTGRVVAPFQRTPSNYFLTGVQHLRPSQMTNQPLRETAMTAAAVGSGAASGSETDDVRKLGVGSAAWGGRGLPFMLGAALTAGPRVLAGSAPISEWGIQQAYSDPKRFLGLEPAYQRAFGHDEQRGRPQPKSRRRKKTNR